jgi:hypothetical protein
MRDTNENMIELLEVAKENEILSALIRQTINQDNLKIRFGINSADYGYLKRILEYRPFEDTGVGSYKYYFVSSYRKDKENSDLCYVNIRIEQLEKHKQYEFTISQKLMANILWFFSLTDKKEVEKMIEN